MLLWIFQTSTIGQPGGFGVCNLLVVYGHGKPLTHALCVWMLLVDKVRRSNLKKKRNSSEKKIDGEIFSGLGELIGDFAANGGCGGGGCATGGCGSAGAGCSGGAGGGCGGGGGGGGGCGGGGGGGGSS